MSTARCSKYIHEFGTGTVRALAQWRKAMNKKNLLQLLSELAAIQLWDQFYLLSKAPDELDRSAWEQRRAREADIYFEILSADLRAMRLQGRLNS